MTTSKMKDCRRSTDLSERDLVELHLRNLLASILGPGEREDLAAAVAEANAVLDSAELQPARRAAAVRGEVTAGQWRAECHGGTWYVFNLRGSMVADSGDDADDELVARIRGVGRGASAEEMHANAELIAEAPAMRAALAELGWRRPPLSR